MKKLLVTVTAIAMLTMSIVAVAASEPDAETVSTNMDATTYLELRTAQLDEALLDGTINQEQYDLLLAHIIENAQDGLFGRGPQGYLTGDSEDCVLGEDGNLGIFRNENSGLGNGGSRGNGGGKGNGGSRGNGGGNGGMRLQDGSANNADCILN